MVIEQTEGKAPYFVPENSTFGQPTLQASPVEQTFASRAYNALQSALNWFFWSPLDFFIRPAHSTQ